MYIPSGRVGYLNDEKILGPGESGQVDKVLVLPKPIQGRLNLGSVLVLNHQITVLNSPGTIDSGYRGEIGVITINHGLNTFNPWL